MQPFAFLISTCLALLMAGISAAQGSPPDNLRVGVQLIEVPLPVLTEWMAGNQTGGAALHQQAMAFVKIGGAKLIDSNVVMTRSGRKATLESIREEINPTEFSSSWYVCGPSPTAIESAAIKRLANPGSRNINAFLTRDTGLTFEVEPTLRTNGLGMDIRLAFENVARLRLENWGEHVDQWGDASRRMPIYETWRTNTAVTLIAGKFELVSVITPKDQRPVPAVSRRILVFVRADVVPVLHSP